MEKNKSVQTISLSGTSLQDLIAYKKIADLMFAHYDNEAKSFLGEYDPITKSNYEESYKKSNYFRIIRECVREEMEHRLTCLDCADYASKLVFENEKTLA